MTRHSGTDKRTVFGELHSFVYKTVAVLAIWFVLSTWISFGGKEYTDLIFAMVAVLMLMAIGIPFALWLVWRNFAESGERRKSSFRDWASGEFDVWTGRLPGAAVEVLLPIAAVAVGITLFGLVFQLTAHGTL